LAFTPVTARTRASEKPSEISKSQSEKQDSGDSEEPGIRKSTRPKLQPSKFKD
jgi:hypothetical protein